MNPRAGALLLLLLLTAPNAHAQQPANGWHLSLVALRVRFTGAASDTLAVPGIRADLQPQSRFAVAADLTRRRGPWELSLSLGLSRGSLSVQTADLHIVDKTTSTNRWRAGISLGHRLLGAGRNEVVISAGPTADYWQIATMDGRLTPGVEAALDLRLSLGRIEIDNRLAFGATGSPFRQRDLPFTTTTRGLRAFSLGLGARYRLSQ